MCQPWNVRKIEYLDGGQSFLVSRSAVIEGRSVPGRRPPKGCRRLDVPIETPFQDEEGRYLKCYFEEVSELEKARREADSKRRSLSRTLQQCDILGRCNKWDYFATLTFDDKICPAAGFDRSAAASLLSKWLDALKHRYPSIVWFLVMEQGPKNGRWHAHALLAGARLRLEDSGHTTKKEHQTIYNMPLEYPYGFTTVTYIRSSAAAGRYLVKYIKKSLADAPAGVKRYWASRSLNRMNDVAIFYLFDDRREFSDWFASASDCADRVSTFEIEHLGYKFSYLTFYGGFFDDE